MLAAVGSGAPMLASSPGLQAVLEVEFGKMHLIGINSFNCLRLLSAF